MSDNSRILVMGHVKPDGDCVSSSIAMAKYHEGAVMLVSEPLPKSLAWMLTEAPVRTMTVAEALAWGPQVLIVVDCKPTEERTGFPIEKYMQDHPLTGILNIDHHAGRLNEPRLPYPCQIRLDTMVSSTAEFLIRHFIRHPILYVGLVTDTGEFKFSNPNGAMEAALLLNLPEDQITRYRNLLDTRLTFEQLEQIRTASIHHHPECGLVTVNAYTKDPEVLFTLIDLTRGFDFAAIVMSDGYVSLRTGTDLNLATFAKKFGGGGHAKASGCKIEVADADKLIAAFKAFIVEGRVCPTTPK